MARAPDTPPSLPVAGLLPGVEFERGRLFDTADLDEVRDISGRIFNPHRLDLVGRGQRLRARMDHLPAGPLSLNRLTWGAQVRVDPDRLGTYGLISVPVAAVLSAKYYPHDPRMPWALMGAFAVWSVALTALSGALDLNRLFMNLWP